MAAKSCFCLNYQWIYIITHAQDSIVLSSEYTPTMELFQWQTYSCICLRTLLVDFSNQNVFIVGFFQFDVALKIEVGKVFAHGILFRSRVPDAPPRHYKRDVPNSGLRPLFGPENPFLFDTLLYLTPSHLPICPLCYLTPKHYLFLLFDPFYLLFILFDPLLQLKF
jgi:hypothetical protein